MTLDDWLCDAADALLKQYFEYQEEPDDGALKEHYRKDESKQSWIPDYEIRSAWRIQGVITTDDYQNFGKQFVSNFKGYGEVIVNINNHERGY